MKLVRQTRDGWKYHLNQREGDCLRSLLNQFPITAQIPAQISRTDADPKSIEREKLLNESLAEHRTELKQQAANLLAPGKFKPGEKSFLLALNPEEREILLQILNDIRIGCWRVLGEPEDLEPERAQDALAGQLVAEAKTNQSQRDFARAEISAARALTIRDNPETRQLLLAARTGGVSLASSSADEAPQSKLSIMSRDGGVVAAVIPDAAGTPAAISVRSTSAHAEMWRIDLPPSASLPDTMALSERDGNTRQIAISWPEAIGSAPAVFHVGIWSLEDGKPAGRFRELLMEGLDLGRHTKRVPAMAFDPGNPWIATGGEDGKLCLWDYSGVKPHLIWEQEDTHEPNVHGIAFNKDGSLLASGGGDYLVKTWRTAEMAKNYDPKIAYVPHKIEPDTHADRSQRLRFRRGIPSGLQSDRFGRI